MEVKEEKFSSSRGTFQSGEDLQILHSTIYKLERKTIDIIHMVFHCSCVSDCCVCLYLLCVSWSDKYQTELYVYGENNGVIWDLSVNRTTELYDKLFVVGAFDTETKTSQVQLCSVGEYNGVLFSKVFSMVVPLLATDLSDSFFVVLCYFRSVKGFVPEEMTPLLLCRYIRLFWGAMETCLLVECLNRVYGMDAHRMDTLPASIMLLTSMVNFQSYQYCCIHNCNA